MLAGLTGTNLASLIFQVGKTDFGGLTPDQIHDIAVQALKRPGGEAQGFLALLVPFAFFATIVAIFWLFIRQRQARIQARIQFQKQLLDKFSSGREFAEFLGSEGSQQFLQEFWSQSRGPREPILSALRNGIVLAVLGLGMLGLSLTRRGFLVPAVLVLALGVGFLISMAISYRLSKQWEQNQKSSAENAPVS
jgi:hypothetical protein